MAGSLTFVELFAYLGSVVAICGLAISAIYAVVGQLGRRFDDLERRSAERFDEVDRRSAERFDEANRRFDEAERRSTERFDEVDRRFTHLEQGVGDRFDGVDRRLMRLEGQSDTLIDAVGDLRERVTRLEVQRA